MRGRERVKMHGGLKMKWEDLSDVTGSSLGVGLTDLLFICKYLGILSTICRLHSVEVSKKVCIHRGVLSLSLVFDTV